MPLWMGLMGHQFASYAMHRRRCSNAKMLRCSHVEAGLLEEVQRNINFATQRKEVGHQSYLSILSQVLRTQKGPTLCQKSQTLQQLELQVST